MNLQTDVFTAIEETLAEGNDIWELVTGAGIEAQTNMDAGRWLIGDLATLVDKKYGEDRIGQFADAINVEVPRVKQYRTVCQFWQKSTRVEILDSYPNITYTHMRIAMDLKDITKAIAFIEECAENDWRSRDAEKVLVERGIKVKPKLPVKLVEMDAAIVRVDKEVVSFELDTAAVNRLLPIDPDHERLYRLVIYDTEGNDAAGE